MIDVAMLGLIRRLRLRDGHLIGADDHFVYEGSYAERGSGFVAVVTVHQTVPNASTIFGNTGMEEFVLHLEGAPVEGKHIFAGNVLQSGSLEIAIGLTLRAAI